MSSSAAEDVVVVATLQAQLFITGTLDLRIPGLQTSIEGILGPQASHVQVTVTPRFSQRRRKLTYLQYDYNEVNIDAFIVNATTNSGYYGKLSSDMFEALGGGTASLANDLDLSPSQVAMINGQFCLEKFNHCPGIGSLSEEYLPPGTMPGQTYAEGWMTYLLFPLVVVISFLIASGCVFCRIHWLRKKGLAGLVDAPEEVVYAAAGARSSNGGEVNGSGSTVYHPSSMDYHLEQSMAQGIRVLHPKKEDWRISAVSSRIHTWVGGVRSTGSSLQPSKLTSPVPPNPETRREHKQKAAMGVSAEGGNDWLEPYRRKPVDSMNTDVLLSGPENARHHLWSTESSAYQTPQTPGRGHSSDSPNSYSVDSLNASAGRTPPPSSAGYLLRAQRILNASSSGGGAPYDDLSPLVSDSDDSEIRGHV